MVEASCLEWAAVVSVVLCDAMAVIRIVNAARSANDAPSVVRRLYDGFIQLDSYAQHLCTGYRPFLNTIQPQIRSLAKFLANTAAETTSPQQQQQQKLSLNALNNNNASASTPASKISTNSAPGGYTSPLGRLRLLTASPSVGFVSPSAAPPTGKYPLPRSLSDPMALKADINRDVGEDGHSDVMDSDDALFGVQAAKRSLDGHRLSGGNGLELGGGRKHGVAVSGAGGEKAAETNPVEEDPAGCILS